MQIVLNLLGRRAAQDVRPEDAPARPQLTRSEMLELFADELGAGPVSA